MESTPEQVAESCAVVKVLAAVLERLIGVNSSIQNVNPGAVTKFHALKPPSIAVLAYLERIHKYASCSTECFILALIYIDRLIQRNNFLLSELNVHRVVITSIMLAAKFFDDQYYNNAYYAKVGGVLVSEMNSLEVEFLFRLNFSLHVTPDVFGKYHAELVAHAVSTSPVASPPILPISGASLTQSVHPTVVSPVEVTPESKSEETVFPTGVNQQNYDFNLPPIQRPYRDHGLCENDRKPLAQYSSNSKNNYKGSCIPSQYDSHHNHIPRDSPRMVSSGGVS